MKILINFIMLLATFSLAAQEYSFDLSNPSHRPKISTPDGSVSLSGEEILSWNAACKNYELALNKLDEKDYENALYLSQQAVKLAPEKVFERWAILILRGDVLRFAGKYEEARSFYLKVALDKHYSGAIQAQALYKTGLSYYDQKEYLKAHPYFERVYVLYYKLEYWASRAYLYDAKAFYKLGQYKFTYNILREYLYKAKIREGAIFEEAKALNVENLKHLK